MLWFIRIEPDLEVGSGIVAVEKLVFLRIEQFPEKGITPLIRICLAAGWMLPGYDQVKLLWPSIHVMPIAYHSSFPDYASLAQISAFERMSAAAQERAGRAHTDQSENKACNPCHFGRKEKQEWLKQMVEQGPGKKSSPEACQAGAQSEQEARKLQANSWPVFER